MSESQNLEAELVPANSVTATRRRHNLRSQPTPLVGRAGELKLAAQVLLRDEVRLLTFVGTAGAGKTRLAQALAEGALDLFGDGVFFVDLARVEDPRLVTAAIADVVGVREARDESLLERLEVALSGRHVLLVLDNFEHILAAAGQVADLLAVCPDLKIVATSRASLRLRWEHVFPVRPLALANPSAGADVAQVWESPAVQLFVQRTQAIDPTFQLTAGNAAVVAQICARLDGLPLAIELAAARTRHLPVHLLLSRLAFRLDVLVEGARDLPPRHRTLRDAIAYSYELLGADDQALFHQIAVFSGGCTAEATIAVLADMRRDGRAEAFILDRLDSLVDKSLLQRDHFADGAVRFRMLETIREYALGRLESSGSIVELQNRWIDYFVDLVHRSRVALLGRDQGTAVTALNHEHDNLLAALRWCIDAADAVRGLQIAAGLWQFWNVRGLFTEGRALLAELLALPAASARTALRAHALSAAGDLAYNQGDDAAAEAMHSEGLTIWRELGDRRGVAAALDTLGALAYRCGECERAVGFLEESLLVKRERQDRWGIASTLHHLGEVALIQGHHSSARTRFEGSLLEWVELGDSWSIAKVLESFAALAQARGQSVRALRLAGSAAVLRERLGPLFDAAAHRQQFQRVLQAAEQSVGRDRVSDVIAEGRAMDLDAAVLYARTVEESPAAAESPAALPAQGPLAWLTPREREVAALLLRGLSNRHIAEELVITERTAETHVCRILSKLGLDSRAQIAAWIIDNGLMDTRVRAAS